MGKGGYIGHLGLAYNILTFKTRHYTLLYVHIELPQDMLPPEVARRFNAPES